MADVLRAAREIELLEPAADEVAAAVGGAEILVTHAWEPAFLTPSLRWVQSVSAGVEQFPLEQLTAAGVTLTSARGVHAPQVAEHAFALLLSLTRGIGIAMRDATRKEWRPRMAEELTGRTLAVIGLGTIGEEIARRASAWGLDVIGIKSNPAGYAGSARMVSGPDGLIDVCRAADIVVCVLPATPSTEGLIGTDALAALGAGWLINVGRGGVVDEEALIEALDNGGLRGAGLDVFATEPLPATSPLWDHPRVVITPHTAGFSPRYGERLLEVFRANLAGFHGEGSWSTRVQ
ncbi:MAG: D-2-hydroxyacid dehydrogenase [Acidimicrobiia bacterium]